MFYCIILLLFQHFFVSDVFIRIFSGIYRRQLHFVKSQTGFVLSNVKQGHLFGSVIIVIWQYIDLEYLSLLADNYGHTKFNWSLKTTSQLISDPSYDSYI